MPKPSEICEVRALGQVYKIWEQIEVTRSSDDYTDHAMLQVAEFSTGAESFAALKLKPGDPAQVMLAGQLVLDGFVYLRQAAYDARSHGVQIGICSKVNGAVVSTVDAEPGQYINQNLQQIASSVFGKIGIGFRIEGSPPGADMPFPRISEQVGETRFSFIERISRLRNIHLMDDGGNVVGYRGPNGSANAQLQEGRNILAGRLLLRNNDHADPFVIVAQQPGENGADVSATAQSPPAINRPHKFAAEDVADKATAVMRANHEVDWDQLQLVDGTITVPGWLMDGGGLWFFEVRKTVSLFSPMLIPENSSIFLIKAVTHRQSSQDGTTTDIHICDKDGKGLGRAGDPFTQRRPEATPDGRDDIPQ